MKTEKQCLQCFHTVGKSSQPVKKLVRVRRCWHSYLSGVRDANDLHMTQLMSLPPNRFASIKSRMVYISRLSWKKPLNSLSLHRSRETDTYQYHILQLDNLQCDNKSVLLLTDDFKFNSIILLATYMHIILIYFRLLRWLFIASSLSPL